MRSLRESTCDLVNCPFETPNLPDRCALPKKVLSGVALQPLAGYHRLQELEGYDWKD